MIYLTVDKDGKENMWNDLPIKNEEGGYWETNDDDTINATLPSGSIESLIDKCLTWDDYPYTLKDTNGVLEVFLLQKSADNLYGETDDNDEEEDVFDVICPMCGKEYECGWSDCIMDGDYFIYRCDCGTSIRLF